MTASYAATSALRAMLANGMVSCVEKDRDRYGRIVAACHLTGKDLNATMVRRGMAVAYRRFSTDYVDEEAEAQFNRAGMWAGRFAMPLDWRQGK